MNYWEPRKQRGPTTKHADHIAHESWGQVVLKTSGIVGSLWDLVPRVIFQLWFCLALGHRSIGKHFLSRLSRESVHSLSSRYSELLAVPVIKGMKSEEDALARRTGGGCDLFGDISFWGLTRFGFFRGNPTINHPAKLSGVRLVYIIPKR